MRPVECVERPDGNIGSDKPIDRCKAGDRQDRAAEKRLRYKNAGDEAHAQRQDIGHGRLGIAAFQGIANQKAQTEANQHEGKRIEGEPESSPGQHRATVQDQADQDHHQPAANRKGQVPSQDLQVLASERNGRAEVSALQIEAVKGDHAGTDAKDQDREQGVSEIVEVVDHIFIRSPERFLCCQLHRCADGKVFQNQPDDFLVAGLRQPRFEQADRIQIFIDQHVHIQGRGRIRRGLALDLGRSIILVLGQQI